MFVMINKSMLFREFPSVCISHFHVLLDQHKGYKRGVIVSNCQRIYTTGFGKSLLSTSHVMVSWCSIGSHSLQTKLIPVSGHVFSCFTSYRLGRVADWSHFLTYYHSNWFSPSVNSFLMGPISYILSSHSPRHQSLINKHSNQKSRHPRSRVTLPRIFIHFISGKNN